MGRIEHRWEVLARLPDGTVIMYTVPAPTPKEAVIKLVNSPSAWIRHHHQGTMYEVLERDIAVVQPSADIIKLPLAAEGGTH